MCQRVVPAHGNDVARALFLQSVASVNSSVLASSPANTGSHHCVPARGHAALDLGRRSMTAELGSRLHKQSMTSNASTFWCPDPSALCLKGFVMHASVNTSNGLVLAGRCPMAGYPTEQACDRLELKHLSLKGRPPQQSIRHARSQQASDHARPVSKCHTNCPTAACPGPNPGHTALATSSTVSPLPSICWSQNS